MAIYNTESSFPNNVDDLYFISDIGLNTKDKYEYHKKLIKEGKYTEASNYLNQQTGITPITADFFNMLENRIYQTQVYVLNKEKINPVHYSDNSEPSDVLITPIWISDMSVND